MEDSAVFINRLLKLGIPLLLVFSSWVQADSEFSRVYVFGDSLSDTGNLASVTGPFPAPPFFMNRVSNGQVAVEILAARLGLDAEASLHLIGPEIGSNYAVAGARAADDDPIDLNAQLIAFQVNNGFVAPSDALYVMFLGGNDVRDARDEASLADARAIVKAAAAEIGNAIETLAEAGAQHFLPVNAPNIGVIPETRIEAAETGDPKLIKRARRLSKLYRKELHHIVGHLNGDDEIEIVEFDLFKFLQRLLRKADKLGFSNTTDPCFFTQQLMFNPDCNFGANFDQFVFFDEIHHTARVHALVGEAMFEELEEDGDDDDEDDDEDKDD